MEDFNSVVFGKEPQINPLKAEEKKKELDLRVNTKADTREKHILVCHGTGCTSSKSPEILETFRKILKEKNIDNVKVILERTPPELAADIFRHGIYLTGGASQVNHLAEEISKGTGLKVNISDHPLTSVAVGLSKIIKEDNYKTVAYAIEGMSK